MDQALDTPDIAAAGARRELDFRKDINGLRALAVLAVVAFHAERGLFPGGFSGVDVFFVISGFLISRIILSECAAGDFRLAMFYAKRAKRILPALLVVVACVWAVGWFRAAPSQFRDIGGGLLGNSYFTLNFWFLRLAGVTGYFGADSSTRPLLHLWSLSIEEQFYLVWSILLLALFKLRRSLLLPVIAAIFVASLAACLTLTPLDPIAAFYSPWTRAWELALGALLAYREVFLIPAWPYPGRTRADAGAALGIALMFGALFLLSEAQPFPSWRALIPTAGCALVIAHPGSRFTDLVLGNRVAGFFGVISYPLYLWHWPLFAFAHMWPGVIPTAGVLLALAAVAVGLAALTYRWVEAQTASLFRRRPLATALALLGLLAATGILGHVTYDSKGFPGRFPPLVARIFDFDVNGAQGARLMQCLYQRDKGRYSLEDERERAARFFDDHRCTAIDDPGKPTILVVGDSHAAHLFAGLTEVFAGKANILALASVFCA
ncbi:MAG: acyltransferase, partial [Hyphomicrobiales bacterium]|nr:acyltransferase [Hyphomicrobiales bacterium]